MGMELLGHEDRRFYFDIFSWRRVLNLAQQYGWEPAGTEPPQLTFFREDGTVNEEMTEGYRQMYEDWDTTDYFTNGLQWVTDKDAANIAEALERALDDIPDFDTGNKIR